MVYDANCRSKWKSNFFSERRIQSPQILCDTTFHVFVWISLENANTEPQPQPPLFQVLEPSLSSLPPFSPSVSFPSPLPFAKDHKDVLLEQTKQEADSWRQEFNKLQLESEGKMRRFVQDKNSQETRWRQQFEGLNQQIALLQQEQQQAQQQVYFEPVFSSPSPPAPSRPVYPRPRQPSSSSVSHAKPIVIPVPLPLPTIPKVIPRPPSVIAPSIPKIEEDAGEELEEIDLQDEEDDDEHKNEPSQSQQTEEKEKSISIVPSSINATQVLAKLQDEENSVSEQIQQQESPDQLQVE